MKILTGLIEAHIVRFNEGDIEYLLLKRSPNQKYPNLWQMVTGKIKDGEKAHVTSVREIKEETGLSVEKLLIVPNVNSFYNSYDESINFIPVFLAIVDNNASVVLSDEHQTFQWANKKKAKKLLAWPGQSKSVNIIHNFLKNKKENLNFIEIDLKKFAQYK